MHRLVIVHAWSCSSADAWYPWLKQEMEKLGWSVIVPDMPETDTPDITAWTNKLAEVVGTPDEKIYFVGHSIGGQTIMRYLETVPESITIGGVVFVASWFHLMNLENEESEAIAKPWLETPINFEKVRRHSNNFAAIFSDDDPFVPVSDVELFRNNLGASIAVLSGKGHLDELTELPEARDLIREMEK